MAHSVKIRTLLAPEGELSSFDPGAYLCGLEFYDTADAVTEDDRDDLAQFAHYIAFLALRARSTNFAQSVIPRGTSAYSALESHFGHFADWPGPLSPPQGLSYRSLVTFLVKHYPPHPPTGVRR